MEKFDFEIEMKVRDYECDIQGIVNNANYLHYLEHCRHQFLHRADLNFEQLHNDGIDAVVVKAELEYKHPLRPNDEFIVRLKTGRQGRLRVIFDQEIATPGGKLIASARITTVLLRKNRPISPDILAERFKNAGIGFEEVS
jgi:acyl-CoA thioester hydrolase